MVDMSRIGSNPIIIPDAVTLTLEGQKQVLVKGPKGQLSLKIPRLVSLKVEESKALVVKDNDTKQADSLQGTIQRLLTNMIIGVTNGFEKQLELVGTGYRVAKQGKKIVLSLGYSHTIDFEPPENIALEIEGNNKIKVTGIDKQQVGQVAATIRSFRPPEPYKGKGVKYSDEVVRRKAGKAAKA